MKKPEELHNRAVHATAERLSVAHAVAPPSNAHCGHCFGEGRESALGVMEHGVPDDPGADRLKAARNAGARPGIDVHCAHCFDAGRDAGLEALLGEAPETLPAPTPPPSPEQLPGGPAAPAKPVHLPKSPA